MKLGETLSVHLSLTVSEYFPSYGLADKSKESTSTHAHYTITLQFERSRNDTIQAGTVQYLTAVDRETPNMNIGSREQPRVAQSWATVVVST